MPGTGPIRFTATTLKEYMSIASSITEALTLLLVAVAALRWRWAVCYGINDIRLFYENDVRFLKQF